MMLENFIDVSEALRPGIFVLCLRGRVVFVGRATKLMMGSIVDHRYHDFPSWVPRVEFDQVLVRAVHPDRVKETYRALIRHYDPIHNRANSPHAEPVS